MAKLYYRYGTVSSSKTLSLLAVAENYKVQGRSVVLIKPKLDTRFGLHIIRSRAGLETSADILLSEDGGHTLNGDTNPQSFIHLPSLPVFKTPSDVYCVLVDEAQFLSPTYIEELREIATEHGIPVICYGLRTDFRSRLFPASKRLFELADSIEEIKTTCFYCGHSKAVLNVKHVDKVATLEGPSIQLGCEEVYYPSCYKCYKSKLIEANPKTNKNTNEDNTHSYLKFYKEP